MILYDLKCKEGHEFEGWFKDRESFEHQRDNNMIRCVVCNSTKVSQLPSGFAIKTSKGFTPATRAVRAVYQYVQDYLEKNFEDVGPRFAEEALKIHYGQTKKRNIRGVTTEQQEKMLKEEGIEFQKIVLPKFDA